MSSLYFYYEVTLKSEVTFLLRSNWNYNFFCTIYIHNTEWPLL